MKRFFKWIVFCFLPYTLCSQSMVLSLSNPSSIHLCTSGDFITIELRNISTSAIGAGSIQLSLPENMEYASGSLLGNGISESNVSNPARPIFTFSSIGLASSITCKLRCKVLCGASNKVSSGALFTYKVEVNQGSTKLLKTSTPLNILQPSLQILSISQSLNTLDVKDTFSRKVVLSNSGNGKLVKIALFRMLGSGLQWRGAKPKLTQKSKDTFWHILDSSYFKKIGNKDIYFDKHEQITFVDSFQNVACDSLDVHYQAVWYCGRNICIRQSKKVGSQISTKSPKIKTINTSYTTPCFDFSKPHAQQSILVNTGNDTARKLTLTVRQSSNNMLSEILTDSFYYSMGKKGKKIKIQTLSVLSYANRNGIYACLGNNAAASVIVDLPALNSLDSIYVYWHSRACISENCNAAFWSNRWYTLVNHQNQCKNQITEGTTWGSYGYYQSIRFTKLAPTDIKPSRDAELNYEFNSGRLVTASTAAKSSLDLILEAGLSHSLQAADFQFIHQNGTSWKPNKLIKKGDTIRAVFYGSPKVTLNRGELKIKIKGNCINTKNNNLKYKIQWRYNPDTTCAKNKWFLPFCDEDQIKLHCSPTCAYGLHFNDFLAERISFGKPDNNSDGIPDSTGSIDKGKVKMKKIMFGDTLKATFRGKIYSNSFRWNYCRAISKIRLGKFLDVQSVRAKIYRSNVQYFNGTGINYSQNTTGQNSTFSFDLSYAGLTAGGSRLPTNFNYQNADSIELEVLYIVNDNYGGNIGEMEFTNEFYISSVSNPSASQKFQCDTFSDRLNLVGYYFTNWGPGTYNNSGCKEQYISQNFYLGLGPCCSNYAGNDIFPYEYRNWANVEKVIVHLPKGFTCQEARMWHYGTKGIGSIRNQYNLKVYPSSSNTNQVVFSLDSLFSDKGGEFLLSDDGFHGVFQPKITTNCVANSGSNTVNYSFVFRQRNQLGNGLDTLYSSNSRDLVNIEKANINIVAQEQEVNPANDTAIWVISVSNTNRQGIAEKLFFGARKYQGMQLLQIKELSSNKLLSKQNDIFLFGTLAAQAQKQFEVKAKFTACTPKNFDLLAGWDCVNYPDSLDDYACQFSKVNLSLKVINTRLEISLNDSNQKVDLCSPQQYEVQLSNVGQSNVYNPFIDIYLQPGMELSDTLWLFYKSAQDSSLVRNPSKVANNVYRFYLEPYDALLKKKGIEKVNSSRANAQLKFKINTNCNFISGSFFMLKPGGFLKCGDPVYAGITAGKPIRIKGVKQPYYSSLKFTMNPLDACNYEDNTTVKFLNLGPDSTTQTDKIIFNVPKGFYINPTKTVSLHNGIQKITYDTTNGNNRYIMDIPVGIAPGDSAHFQLATYVLSDELVCGQVPLYMQAVVMQSVTCVKNNSSCKIFVNTSDQLLLDSVKKSIYQLKFVKAKSMMELSEEWAEIDYEITNMGTVKKQNINLGVKLIFDANKNGIVDPSDTLLARDTISVEIKKNQTVKQRFRYLLQKGQACNLLLHIDAKSCLCEEATEAVGRIVLQNVRSDTTICSYDPILVGTKSPAYYTYSWNDTQRINQPTSSLAYFSAQNFTASNAKQLIKLTTDRGNCKSIDSAFITVYPAITIDMKDTADMCEGFPIRIGNIADGGVGRIKQYAWTPQDSLSDPFFTRPYANIRKDKKYFVSVTDPTGCYLHDSLYVRVNKNPQANFIVNNACVFQLVETKNKSSFSNPLVTTSWTIGKDSFDVFEPKVMFDSSGHKAIKLWIVDSRGCQDTIRDTLQIYKAPKPSLQIANGCQMDYLSYVATTQSTDSFSHYWRINNDSIVGDTAIIRWKTDGKKEIVLATRTPFGCEDYTIDTTWVYQKPVANFDYKEKCLGDTIFYISKNTSIDTILNYNWRLDTQLINSSKQFKMVHNDTGKFNMSLEIETNFACKDTLTKILDVFPKPSANFVASNICLGDTLHAIDQAIFPRNKVKEIKWYWKNQEFVQVNPLLVVPKKGGQSHIWQYVENQFGCKDSIQKTFWTKSLVSPIANFSGKCENEYFTWEATPSPIDSLSELFWVFEGDTIQKSNWRKKLSSGAYQVQLFTKAKNDCIKDSTYNFNLLEKPQAQIDISLPCSDNLALFKSPNINPQWTLGDGKNSVLDSFEYAYSDTGLYTVSLILTDDLGCKDTAFENIKIQNIVRAKIVADSVCIGDQQIINNASEGLKTSISNSIFDLGDGNTVSNQNTLLYTYQKSGLYTIFLKFETLPNCFYEATKSIEIYPLPKTGFDFFPNETDILNANIEFIDKSVGATKYQYEISDSSLYTDASFFHQFSDSGTYEIKQILTSKNGCEDSIAKMLKVHFLATTYIPNAFSPNNNDINEAFKPIGLGMKSYQMKIYNRWGQLIFDGAKNQAWNGKKSPLGVYQYQIRTESYNGEVKYLKGTVKLLR